MEKAREEQIRLKVMNKKQLVEKLVKIINNDAYEFYDLIVSTPISGGGSEVSEVAYSGKVVIKIEGRFEI